MSNPIFAVNPLSSQRTEIVYEVIQMVRKQIGPVAAFKIAAVVHGLPKTRSGKILRGTIKSIADGKPFRMPATIDDPTTLDDISVVLKELGVGAN